jgi:hypothetical protein
VLSKAVERCLKEHAPTLLNNIRENEDQNYGTKTPGRNKLLASLVIANTRLLREVIPVVSCNPWIDVELYFSDPVITNAFKNKRIEAWAASNFCRRAGNEMLMYSEQWSHLYWLVNELSAEVCYTPLVDKTMIQLLTEVRELV